MNKKMKAVKIAARKGLRFLKLFFKPEINLYDLPPAAFRKAVRVLHIHRMAEVELYAFRRVSWTLFYDPDLFWGYDIQTGEFD